MASESNTGSDGAECYILKCPPELILLFNEALGGDVHSRLSFRGSCQAVNAIVEGDIYRHNIRNKGASCMVWAATNGQLETMMKAVAAGGDPTGYYENIFDSRTQGPRYRVHFPLLHFALANGHAEVATYLIGQGVEIHKDAGQYFNPHVDFEWPQSTWDLTSPRRRSDTVGSDYDRGFTPLQIAIGKGLLSVAKLLINSGDLGIRTGNAYDPFRAEMAIRRASILNHHTLFPDIEANIPAGTLETIILPRGKRRIRGQPNRLLKQPALYFTVQSDQNVETARALLALEANPHGGYSDPYTPLDHAAYLENWKVALALIQPPTSDCDGNKSAHLNWDKGMKRTTREKVLAPLRTTLFCILTRLEEGTVTLPTDTWLQDSLAVIEAFVVKYGKPAYDRLSFADWKIWDHLDPDAWYTRRYNERGIQQIAVPPLQFAAYYCRKSPHAIELMKLLLNLGVWPDDLGWGEHKSTTYERRHEGGHKTALQYLVEALEINHYLDYGKQDEEEIHAYLERESDQVRLGHKERRILDAIDLLLSRGASPERWVPGARDRDGYRVTILELALSRFDVNGRHFYLDHKDARVGLLTLKLVRLFLKHAEPSGLAPSTIRTLERLVPRIIQTLRWQPPVTNLTIRDLEWTGPMITPDEVVCYRLEHPASRYDTLRHDQKRPISCVGSWQKSARVRRSRHQWEHTKYPPCFTATPPILLLLWYEEDEEDEFKAEFYD